MSQRRALGVVVVLMALVVGALGGCGDDEPETRTIAILRALPASNPSSQQEFFDVLAAEGYEEGDNLTVLGADLDETYADPDDAKAAVTRWVDDGVDLIVALSTGGAKAAAEATSDVPILFLSNDPLATGLLTDERRPEANLTGATFRVPADRTLALAAEAFGEIERVGCLYAEADEASEPGRRDLLRGAAALDMRVTCVSVAHPDDIAAGVQEIVDSGAGLVVLVNSPTLVRLLPALRPALAVLPLPVVANTSVDFAALVLQPDIGELYRQMGRQAVRLLDGVDVATVPVQDPGEFDLVINAAVAERLGLEIPASVLDDADTVIPAS